MKKKVFATLAIAMICNVVGAQPFTLDNEYKRQLKYYPNIEKHISTATNIEATENVVYKTIGDTIKLCMDVYMPQNVSKKLTPIVFIHGGGWRSGAKELDTPMAQNLASTGDFVCVCVDYRLSDVALYPAGLQDVNSALSYIAERADDWHIDIGRLTLVGSSSGGQMVALLGATNGSEEKYFVGTRPPHIHRVVDIDGVLAFIHPDSAEGQDRPGKPSAATLWFGKPVSEAEELWQEASAVNHVGEQSAHYVFVNSSYKRFSAGQDEMSKLLKKYNKEVSVFKTTDTPHTFWLFKPWAPIVENVIRTECAR
mgnify:CR=1 FL=1